MIKGLGRTAIAVAALCTQALAEEHGKKGFSGTLQRGFELPAHRGLLNKMTSEDVILAPFATDGCSGGLSASWTVVADLFPSFEEAHEDRPPWESCCLLHDRHYHRAGGALTPEQSYDARLAADEQLRACVVAGGETRVNSLSARYNVSPDQVRLAYSTIGDAMYNAVRFGGAPCSGLPWRWGYGYPGCLPSLQ
ncbi:MAG: hypothetical protein QNI90_06195 [Dinoroseobacter sp.]|nr:hypothetical protein [Dinoroseobacter sp.]